MSKLTDEQIKDCLDAADQMYCPRDGDKEIFKARAIEAAATEPLLQRIAELERELEAVRKDAERWRTFLNTRPASTHEIILQAIDDAAMKEQK